MPTLLIVDSAAVRRICVSAVLREGGCARNVLTAATGLEALSLVKAFHPLYIITAVRLYDMHAWTLCEQVRRADRRVRMLLASETPQLYGWLARYNGMDGCMNTAELPAAQVAHVSNWLSWYAAPRDDVDSDQDATPGVD